MEGGLNTNFLRLDNEVLNENLNFVNNSTQYNILSYKQLRLEDLWFSEQVNWWTMAMEKEPEWGSSLSHTFVILFLGDIPKESRF